MPAKLRQHLKSLPIELCAAVVEQGRGIVGEGLDQVLAEVGALNLVVRVGDHGCSRVVLPGAEVGVLQRDENGALEGPPLVGVAIELGESEGATRLGVLRELGRLGTRS